jgi:NADH-quinone oxidoreductase subunit G
VLRVLGSLLGLSGFGYESIEAVRAELPHAEDTGSWLSNATQTPLEAPPAAGNGEGFERVAEVPIYAADPLVRRAASLQKTRDAAAPRARMHAATIARLKLADGAAVRVRQGDGEAILTVAADAGVPEGCVRIAAAHPATRTLGPMFGPIAVEPL